MQRIKRVIAAVVILLSLSNVLPAEDYKKAENFTLKDYNGKSFSLSDFKNSKAIVLMFVSTQCPVSNAYNERMAQLYEEYKAKGIQFIGINSNKQESVDEIKEHAKSNNLGFTILKDEQNIIADKFEASFTPEIYVLNGNLSLLYHGRIDDNRKSSEVKVTDLKNTLDEILTGKNVSNPKTKAFGCSIKIVSK